MKEIRRVFFHELGHFVANLINQRNLGGGGTEEILIYPCEQDPQVYCGETKPARPKECDKNAPPPIERLAQCLLSSSYGCIFQAYEQKTTLKHCFEVNGTHDVKSWSEYLNHHRISYANREFVKLDEQYLEQLKAISALDDFLVLNPSDYLDFNDNDQYLVNLEFLEKALGPIIAKHEGVYMEQIEKYQKVIDSSKPYESLISK